MRNISSAFSIKGDARFRGHDKFGDSRDSRSWRLSWALQHAFAAGDALHVAGRCDGHGDGAGECLEDGF